MLDKFRKEKCQDKQLGTDWVLGFGHSITEMLDYLASNPAKDPIDLLDEVLPDRPAIMMEETSHSVWVNSKALE